MPELEAQGAATWGHTRDEALRNTQDVTQLVVEELLEDGQPLPAGVTITEDPVVRAKTQRRQENQDHKRRGRRANMNRLVEQLVVGPLARWTGATCLLKRFGPHVERGNLPGLRCSEHLPTEGRTKWPKRAPGTTFLDARCHI